MADVLFGQSYFLRFDRKLWEAMQPYPPLGTLYAASHVRSLGYSVALFDAMLAESTSGWREALDLHQPTFAVLFEDSFNYLSKMCLLRMREAAFEMLGDARRSGCTTIVSASDASDHIDRYLDAGADYVLLGEAERGLGELLDSLVGRSPIRPEDIPGVADTEHRGPSRRTEKDFDRLPPPAWDLVAFDRYRRIWEERHGYFSVNMVTTRGCPYSCNWCAKPIFGRSYSIRSPQSVVDELDFLRRKASPDHIWFCDDIFGLKKGWISDFADLVCSRGLRTPFKCLLRTDLVDESTARDLKRAGCRTVWVGAESGSQKILDAMDKGASVDDTRRAAELLKRAGIEVGFFLQFGYPGEDWHDIRKTFQLVRECRPDDIGVSVAYPLPGTKFYDRVARDLGEKQNWIDSEDLAMLYRGPYSSGFYRQLHRTLHKDFRARTAVRSLLAGQVRAIPRLARSLTLPLEFLRLQHMRRSEEQSGQEPCS